MEAYQLKIYQGLQHIGEAIANFYKDGVDLVSPQNSLASKANYIGHTAREIDGGLRDVFAPEVFAYQHAVSLAKPDDEEIKITHFTSILAAVGSSDPNNSLAKKWYGIAKKFHRIAHRGHVYDNSRDPADAISSWLEYEKVLTVVIGSFIGISNRLDVLLQQETPQTDILRSCDESILFIVCTYV